MAEETKTFGWYYDEGSVQETDDNVWRLINEAVYSSVDKMRVDSILVGEMEALTVGSLLGVSDIEDHLRNAEIEDEAVDAASLLELVRDALYDDVRDGAAHFRCSDDEAKDAVERVFLQHALGGPGLVAALFEWLKANVALEPAMVCMGRSPFPITLHDGVWKYGHEPREGEPPPIAEVFWQTTATHDRIDWPWQAGERSGTARTLLGAMWAVEAAVKP